MTYKTLVDTAELERHLDDPLWIIFDCRHNLAKPDEGRAEYLKSHLPGARFLHLERDLSAPVTGSNGRHPLPDPRVFAAKLGEAGVDARCQVVTYDAQGGMYAARLWWMLRWLGHEEVAVLDGGWARWEAENRPRSAAAANPVQARFSGTPRDRSVGAEYVLARLNRPDMLLLDARSGDRFRGENETIDPVGGRIPGAVNRDFRTNLGSDGTFKPAAQLRAEFAALLGGRAPGQVVHSCGSGVSACHNLLAMEIAGIEGSRLYPGSWSEWCSDPSRPIARGEPDPPRG